jgi:hypothetical protein
MKEVDPDAFAFERLKNYQSKKRTRATKKEGQSLED